MKPKVGERRRFTDPEAAWRWRAFEIKAVDGRWCWVRYEDGKRGSLTVAKVKARSEVIHA